MLPDLSEEPCEDDGGTGGESDGGGVADMSAVVRYAPVEGIGDLSLLRACLSQLVHGKISAEVVDAVAEFAGFVSRQSEEFGALGHLDGPLTVVLVHVQLLGEALAQFTDVARLLGGDATCAETLSANVSN